MMDSDDANEFSPQMEMSLSSIENQEEQGPRIEAHKYVPRFGPNVKLQHKGTREISVFYPTPKEMSDFSAYIEAIERKGAHLESGIAKIIPPPSWTKNVKPTFNYDNLNEMRIKQCLAGKIQKPDENVDGVYYQVNGTKTFNKSGILLGDFMQKATGSNCLPRKCKKLDDVVDYFWNNIDNVHNRASLYGADIEGSLFADSINEFNPNKLGTLIDLAKESGMQIPGITSPYLYFGSYRTAFPWHTEDLDLYSLNYQHFGEPKIWYSIPSIAANRFERLCAQLYQNLGTKCHSFIRHKLCLTRPDILEKHQIPYGVIAQYPGEFIVTFPRGYHMGFNVGFNANEAINFGVSRWFGYALQTRICDCNPGMAVRMDLSQILNKYAENEEYKECFIREPVKKTERQKQTVGMRDFIQDTLPNMKRLLLFDSSFEEEIKYNEEQAQFSPFCSICQYFTPETNCQLKGPIKATSKSPCYTSPIMFNKTQTSSIGPYRPDRTSGLPFLPFPEAPLRQCANCKIAVHANCYSFIEGLPKEKAKHQIKQKPVEIQRVPTRPSNQLPSVEMKPKIIRITVPKRCVVADSNIEKEQSLSPVTSTSSPLIPTPRRVILKPKVTIKPQSNPLANSETPDSAPKANNIFKKIMKRIKTEHTNDDANKLSTVTVKTEPQDSEAGQLQSSPSQMSPKQSTVNVIKPILSKYETFEEDEEDSKVDLLTSIFQSNGLPSTSTTNDSEWLCDPCRLFKEQEDQRKYVCCEFCNLRGGALIQHKFPGLAENGYVHIICAIISRSTSVVRNAQHELIAHSLPPTREYSVLKKTQKHVLMTSDSRIRLCSTYSNHEKALFSGNFEDNFCGLCKEALHNVLVKCERCHVEGRQMNVYHPTCAHLLGFQFCAHLYPELAVAICPAHFDLSNDPKTDVKVGDLVLHEMNDGFKSVAEVSFIGTTTSEIVMSYHGGLSEVDKAQVLSCDCRPLGCNGVHIPGYMAAIRNRGAIGVTLSVFRGRHVERTYRIKHDEGLAVSCKRSDFFTHKDSNCPPDAKKLLMKRRAELQMLDQMNVPIKRERKTTTNELNGSQTNGKNSNSHKDCLSISSNQSSLAPIKQEILDE